jgi:endogenous inhibitor of DNA gyrase (YacG/DUF329 family)
MVSTVTCPHCRLAARWSEDNPYRPFCSRRCKLVDLGDWIEERHGIPGEPGEADIGNTDGELDPDENPFG